MRAERNGALGGSAQGDPGLRGDGVALSAFGGVLVGRQVVAGEGTGQLIGSELLEVARRGEVA